MAERPIKRTAAEADELDMSDLSRLLGDVYNPDTPEHESGDGDGERVPVTTTALPEWADEAVLDEAFSNWVPGPPADAPKVERSMLSDLASGPQAEWMGRNGKSNGNDSDGGPKAVFEPGIEIPLSEAELPYAVDPLATTGPVPLAVEPEPVIVMQEAAPEPWRSGWQRSDDDILPRHSRRSFLRR